MLDPKTGMGTHGSGAAEGPEPWPWVPGWWVCCCASQHWELRVQTWRYLSSQYLQHPQGGQRGRTEPALLPVALEGLSQTGKRC